MEKSDLKQFINKRIKITLKNGYVYSCTVNDVSESIIDITDINNDKYIIALSEISIVKEVSNA